MLSNTWYILPFRLFSPEMSVISAGSMYTYNLNIMKMTQSVTKEHTESSCLNTCTKDICILFKRKQRDAELLIKTFFFHLLRCK